MAVTYDMSVPLARNPVIVVTVLGALATVSTALRFFSLRIKQMSPSLPEYLILAALEDLVEILETFQSQRKS
ncbi:hypothetical protein N7495_010055 [Penicillium taxi]|uniref:uncharacterized protein n=1 Tax=Penicillium taxi TaxID=168475 RepID=UPI002545B0FD|nr:uncharacterized protein N7495_010055 [Penicillium taxi]KAJ5885545.1 hypothetical protein N7495_010055 [Penicillium taxi]